MMSKIEEYKEGFRNYEEHTPSGAKIVFNMLCNEYEKSIAQLQSKLEDQVFLKFQLQEAKLMYDIVTGETNGAQKELLKLYDDYPDYLQKKLKGWLKMSKKVNNLLDREGNWETKSKQASLKGDYDRAGRLHTKALQLAAEARRIERKESSAK